MKNKLDDLFRPTLDDVVSEPGSDGHGIKREDLKDYEIQYQFVNSDELIDLDYPKQKSINFSKAHIETISEMNEKG